MTVRRTELKWRLILAPPRRGAENMGRDVALVERAKVTGEAVFCVYEWIRPTLSLGRNQLADSIYDRSAIASAGIDVVRRPTGGRALLHDREVTYSVTAPSSVASLSESYARVNEILVRGLERLGVNATISRDGPTGSPGAKPCFADPAPGELVVNGRKLVGSAQWRDGEAFLQHGSILVDDDQTLIPRLMRNCAEADQPAAATLASILQRRPTASEVAERLFSSVKDLEDESAEMLSEEDVRSEALARAAEFENELWTWRR